MYFSKIEQNKLTHPSHQTTRHKDCLSSRFGRLHTSQATVPIMALPLACSITGMLLYLSPIPLLQKVQQEQTTSTLSILPLLATTINGSVWCLYGLLTFSIFPMFIVNLFGVILGSTYVYIFCQHTPNQQTTYATILCSLLLLSFLVMTYVLPESGTTTTTTEIIMDVQYSAASPASLPLPLSPAPELSSTSSRLADRVGTLGVCVGICMFAAPFATAREVIRTRNASSEFFLKFFFFSTSFLSPFISHLFSLTSPSSLLSSLSLLSHQPPTNYQPTTGLPFPIICVNLLNACLWTIYGLQLGDGFVWGPNFAGVVCSSLQGKLRNFFFFFKSCCDIVIFCFVNPVPF